MGKIWKRVDEEENDEVQDDMKNDDDHEEMQIAGRAGNIFPA